MRVFLFLLGLFISFHVIGNGVSTEAEFNPNTLHLDLTPHAEVFVDHKNVYNINDIVADSGSIQFKSLLETGNSFGFNPSIFWVRFTVHLDNSFSDSLLLLLEYPLLDDVRLFIKNGSEINRQTTTGDTYSFSQREIIYRDFLFKLGQMPGQTQTYYMRLETEGSMQIPLSLWSSFEFIEKADSSALVYGIYYGVMLVLMIAAAVAYFQLRDFLYLSYSFYLFSFLMFQLALNGFGFQYIWPDLMDWVNRLNSISIGLVVVSGFIFCGTFLRVWQQQDAFKYFYNVFIGIGIISILISIFGNFSLSVKIAAGAGVLLPPIVIVSNISAVMSGYRPARFFLFAWGIFLVGVFVAGLVYFGIVERTFYTHNSMQIASLLEILILGYVLMENVKKLYNEKNIATVNANNYLQQLNEGLESQVKERTKELEEKNKLLSDLALHDSMTGLLNHNTSIDHLKVMSTAALRYAHSLSVVMLDIDHFKQINDKYGHPAGDKVIVAIADVLQKSLRESDSCGRYGGEEFILLLTQTSIENAIALAESIRVKISQIIIQEIDGIPITASFGVAAFNHTDPTVDLISESDKALYRAKENGRNQIVSSGSI